MTAATTLTTCSMTPTATTMTKTDSDIRGTATTATMSTARGLNEMTLVK